MLSSSSKSDQTHFLTVAKDGHLEEIKDLFKKGRPCYRICYRATCLAAEKGHLEVVKYLVSEGADLGVLDKWAVAEQGRVNVFMYYKGQRYN